MLLVNEKTFRNWSESVVFTPNQFVYPESIEDISNLVQHANENQLVIRVVGSAHSFTPLIESKEILVSLDKLQGVLSIDENNNVAEVWSGTKLHLLSDLLFQEGYALENMGDINIQSVAGAFLSGTHGTGAGFGILATQIVEMTVVTANGDIVTCSREENVHLFEALGVSFGMLGIVVKMKIKVIKATPFKLISTKLHLDDVLSSLPSLKKNKHFEFFFFPYGDHAQVKVMNETNDFPKSLKWEKIKSNFVENTVFYALSELCRISPSTTYSISRLGANLISVFEFVGYSHELFAAVERRVKFNEMEYSIPAEKMEEVIREIRKVLKEKKFHVHFPIECRYVKEDSFWLSPAYRRDSAYIAVHMYKGMEHQAYFNEMEAIFQRVGGRPHWAKMHTATHEQIAEYYPRFTEFMELRTTIDPNNIFMNDYLKKLFGI